MIGGVGVDGGLYGVDTASTGDFKNASYHIFALIVDHVVGAQAPHIDTVARRSRGDDGGADGPADLDAKATDSAGAALHPHAVTGLHVEPAHDTLVRSQPGAGNSRSGDEIDDIRDGRRRMGCGDGQLGVAAGIGEIAVVEDPVSDFPLVDVRSHDIDGAGHIEAENVRVGPSGIAAAGKFVVDGVQADGGDIEVLAGGAESQFPDGIRFFVTAQSSDDIEEIRVFFTVVGRSGPSAYRILEFEPGTQVTGESLLRSAGGAS